MSTTVTFLALSCTVGAVHGIHADFVAMLQPGAFHYTGGVYVEEAFHYRLFVPVVETGRKYPILVWLHGLGESGSDNLAHLKWLDGVVMPAPWQRERFPFFVLALQCPKEIGLWNRGPEGTPAEDLRESDMISVNDALLRSLIETHPIDRDRVYLAGVSSGGSGCWAYAVRKPDQFAAVAPLAASAVHNAPIERLVNVPVWAFHSTHDPGTPVEGARRTVDRLRDAGGHARLTEIDTALHDCWSAAFHDHELLRWLLAQRRGGTVYMQVPKRWDERLTDALEGWTVWQLGGQAIVVVLIAMGVWWTVRRLGHRQAITSHRETGTD